MNNREKLENLSGVLNQLEETYVNELKMLEKELALEWNPNTLKKVCTDVVNINARLDTVKYIKGFID